MCIRGQGGALRTPRIERSGYRSSSGRNGRGHGSYGSKSDNKLLFTLGAGTLGGSAFGGFDHHDAGNEFLQSVQVKIYGSTLGIRIGYNSQSILKMLDVQAFTEGFQYTASFDFLNKKNGATRRSPYRPGLLQAGNVRCLQALGAGGNLELNRLPFVQRFISVRLNRGEVDEDVLAGLALDESESLAGIEPLYCSLFFHCISFLLF